MMAAKRMPLLVIVADPIDALALPHFLVSATTVAALAVCNQFVILNPKKLSTLLARRIRGAAEAAAVGAGTAACEFSVRIGESQIELHVQVLLNPSLDVVKHAVASARKGWVDSNHQLLAAGNMTEDFRMLQPVLVLGGHGTDAGEVVLQGEPVHAGELQLCGTPHPDKCANGWQVYVETCFATAVAAAVSANQTGRALAMHGLGVSSHRTKFGDMLYAFGAQPISCFGIGQPDKLFLTLPNSESRAVLSTAIRKMCNGDEAKFRATVAAAVSEFNVDGILDMGVDIGKRLGNYRSHYISNIGSRITAATPTCSNTDVSNLLLTPAGTPADFALVVCNLMTTTDCLLAVHHGQYALAIDGGDCGKHQLAQGRTHYALLAALQNLKAWDLMVTHADQDHIGGAHILLDECAQAAAALSPTVTHDSLRTLWDKLGNVLLNTPWDIPPEKLRHRALADIAARMHVNADFKQKNCLRSMFVPAAPLTASPAAAGACGARSGGHAKLTLGIDKSSDEAVRKRRILDMPLDKANNSTLSIKTLWPTEVALSKLSSSPQAFKDSGNANAACAVVLLTHEHGATAVTLTRVLLTGDAHLGEPACLAAVLTGMDDCTLDVVQLPHHGSSRHECMSMEAAKMLALKCRAGAVLFMSGVFTAGTGQQPPHFEATSWLADAFSALKKHVTLWTAYNWDDPGFSHGATKPCPFISTWRDELYKASSTLVPPVSADGSIAIELNSHVTVRCPPPRTRFLSFEGDAAGVSVKWTAEQAAAA